MDTLRLVDVGAKDFISESIGGVHSLRGNFCFVWSAVCSLMLNPPASCTFHREDVKIFFQKNPLIGSP